MKGLPLYLIFFLLVYTVAHATDKPSPLRVQDMQDFTISRGQVLYERHCLFCHGEQGKGDGQNAYSLSQRPPDFSLTTSKAAREDLAAVIAQGGAEKGLSPEMPSFARTISREKIELLVEHIQSLSTR